MSRLCVKSPQQVVSSRYLKLPMEKAEEKISGAHEAALHQETLKGHEGRGYVTDGGS